ncbi:MAG: diadenylate cyclase CdaA [Lentisphaeria bacterium]|nr:diadenylate cyclase CdaA [Lentisphaeria bacterium]MBQ7404689.1 diadenylate cyclase CdaA [Lentisphaeria bacterium]
MSSGLLQTLEGIYNIGRHFLDYGIIVLMVYYILKFMRGTRAASVLAGLVIALIFLTVLTKTLKFDVLNWLLMNFWTILATALVVIFQPELRRAFAQLGSRYFSQQSDTRRQTIVETVTAVTQMSRNRTGALIVFERQIGLASIKNSAIPLEAKVSETLLLTIFFPNTPLHDGALIIRGDTIEAGHAILPLTQQPEYAKMNLGTRHRAAIGVTEETDAVAVVVSEETGSISVAMRGVLDRNITPGQLNDILSKHLLNSGIGNSIQSKNGDSSNAG